MKREQLRLPHHTTFSIGAFTGRFCSAVILAAIPDYPVLAVEEIPNYHYVGDGEIEPSGMTTIEWAELVVRTWRQFTGPHSRCAAWVDPDTEFGTELKRAKLSLRPNLKRGPELRTEILREYFQDNKLLLMPWLTVLPNEIGKARWPAEESVAYQTRAKGQDFTLSALEQAISRRPKGNTPYSHKATSALDSIRRMRNIGTSRKFDPHLGTL